MLICSVYLPYNLHLSTADRIFLTWCALTFLTSECWWEDAQAPHLVSSTVGLLCLICQLQSHWRWIPAHFQSRNPLQFFQIGWAFSMKTKILHSHALTLTGVFSHWQMYWPTFCAISHCPIFLNVWDKDKCYPWSRDLLSFLLHVAFHINWYQEQGLSLIVEKRNTLQWLWQPCCLI